MFHLCDIERENGDFREKKGVVEGRELEGVMLLNVCVLQEENECC